MDIVTNDKLLRKFLTIYIAIYPIFGLKAFYNSCFTLLQILMLIFFLIWSFFAGVIDGKYLKCVLIYGFFLVIYAVFHDYNAQDFQSLIPGDFFYSRSSELLCLLKLSMPVIFLLLMKSVHIKKESFLLVIKTWIILICGSIVITNILKLSLGSYSDERITGSFIQWINPGYAYTDLASKGFFMYANQITCILLCILPFVMFFYFHKKISIGYVIAIMSTMLLLGTRAANIGSILVFVVLTGAYVFMCFLKKKILDKSRIVLNMIIILIYVLVLPISPTAGRNKVYDYILKEPIVYMEDAVEDQPEEEPSGMIDSSKDKIEYIGTHYEEKLINPTFILKSYPYEYDPDFWYDILELPEEMRANYRFLEISMVKRVVQINNNKMDKLWGITNTRIQNIFNIERDYILQYYAFGIVGMILFLGNYFVIFVKQIWELIRNFNYYNICHLSAVVLFLGVSYLSGNIMGQMFAFISILFLIYPKGEMNIEENNQ